MGGVWINSRNFVTIVWSCEKWQAISWPMGRIHPRLPCLLGLRTMGGHFIWLYLIVSFFTINIIIHKVMSDLLLNFSFWNHLSAAWCQNKCHFLYVSVHTKQLREFISEESFSFLCFFFKQYFSKCFTSVVPRLLSEQEVVQFFVWDFFVFCLQNNHAFLSKFRLSNIRTW